MVLFACVYLLVGELVAANSGAVRVVFAADKKAEFVRALQSACVGPVALGEYLEILAGYDVGVGLYGSPGELPVADVLRDGLGVLSDDVLIAFGLNADAVRAMNKAVFQASVEGTLGDVWHDVIDDVATGPKS